MKGKKTIVLVSAIMLVTSVNLWAQQLTMAVRVFETSGGLSQDEGNAITDLFISELVSTGKVMVVDRSSFEAIIAEMQFHASSWSDNNNVARLGRALNANHIIQGTVTQLGGRIIITVRVLDINTVRFVTSPNLQLANMNEIFTKLTPFVQDLVLSLPGITNVYQVGGIGPSGGYIFYDKGSYSEGWRYLEAAPDNTEFDFFYRSQLYSKNPYHLANGLNVNGFTGWRVPTLTELNHMYGTLKQKGLGNFRSNGHYFCSTVNASNVRRGVSIYFSDGSSNSFDYFQWDHGPIWVRAVRAF